MLLIRRLWLLPASIITLVLYLLFRRASRYAGNVGLSTPVTDTPGGSQWVQRPEHHPVKSFIPLPGGEPKNVPKIQHDFGPETEEQKKLREERQARVKESFVHAWNGYKEHAWGKDEVSPVSGSYRNSFGGWGATLVDSMDTLWIMGLKDDFQRCLTAVAEIDWARNDEEVVNVFETTIRYLGGLLAAYDISDEAYPLLLKRAVDLGEVLYKSFDTPNRMPMTRWEWKRSANGEAITASDFTLIAEIGSLTVEFTRLAQLTKDAKFFDAVQRISDRLEHLQDQGNLPGLWPIVVDAKNLKADQNIFTLGGMADSTYEYLPKQYLMLGGLNDQYRKMYEKAMNVIERYLFFRPRIPDGSDILISGDVRVKGKEPILEPKGQHLACFTGGMVGIGAKVFDRPDDVKIARQLVDGCIWAYNNMPSGLMPEIFHAVPCHQGVMFDGKDACEWNQTEYEQLLVDMYYSGTNVDSGNHISEKAQVIMRDGGLQKGFTSIGDHRYILRPEAIESVFILYRITGDRALQDKAWKMFQNIEKLSWTDIAHAAVDDVRTDEPSHSDRMESFWLAETLKYFYLIFSEPDLISLDHYVLNTEAHPLKRP